MSELGQSGLPSGRFTLGHHDLGGGCHAWLQPDGGWGLSNAGLVAGAGESLLIDTLFDLRLTARMLAGLVEITARAPIRTVLNTHSNGDHWFGNQLLASSQIIASRSTAEEMRRIGPRELEGLLRREDGSGDFARTAFGAFAFSEIEPTYPTRTFDGELAVNVGGVDVRLIDVGPAHTAGDTIVHVPSARTVFTGDIVFAGGTPIVWNGPVRNWLRACELLLDLNVDTVVPGHGPVTTKAEIQAQADYLAFVYEQASARHAAGMSFQEAVRDIDLGRFAALPESERLAANVHAVYRELDPSASALDAEALFGYMGDLMEEGR